MPLLDFFGDPTPVLYFLAPRLFHYSLFLLIFPSDMLPKVPSFIPSFSRNNSNKSSLCHHCTKDESPNMNNLNEVCGESVFMLDMLCINYVIWNQDEYCQHSCFVNGNGYPGNFVVRRQKIQASFLHMYQVGLHPLSLAVFQALYHLIRLL